MAGFQCTVSSGSSLTRFFRSSSSNRREGRLHRELVDSTDIVPMTTISMHKSCSGEKVVLFSICPRLSVFICVCAKRFEMPLDTIWHLKSKYVV